MTTQAPTLRPFTRSDWDAFAGVEPFPDGTDPLLVDGTFPTGRGWLLVLDATGGHLHVERDSSARDGGYRLAHALPSAAAAEHWFRATLGQPGRLHCFVQAGFRQDHDRTTPSGMAEANAALLRQDIDHLQTALARELDRTGACGRWQQVRRLEVLRTVLMRALNESRGLPADDAGALLVLEYRLVAQRR
jgi:hypothetical protein